MATGRRFELVRELGSGAFGTVYLANMVSGGDFRKRVAIKLLNAQWDAGGDAGRRLRDEARLLGLLRHRSIVAVDDLVLLDGRWAVVMEHVPGADLERVLEAGWRLKRTFPLPAAMEVISAVAGALDAAWSGTPEGGQPLRVVHRDIKPSNIRLTADGDIKVLDFGIARGNFESREARTEQVRYGSLGYMAPERVLGDEEGPAGDVYAVACVAIELLRGKALGRSALLPDQHATQVQAALDEIEGQLGAAATQVRELLAEMLAYDQHARPTAAAVAERARKLGRALPGDDLSEFARQIVPLVTAMLGDQGKEAQGQLSEQVASDRAERKDTETLAALVEGSPFDRTSQVQSAPLEPTAVMPGRGRSRNLVVGVAVGLALVVGVGVALLLRAAPETPEPAAAAPTAQPPVAAAEPPVAPAPVPATETAMAAAQTPPATTAPTTTAPATPTAGTARPRPSASQEARPADNTARSTPEPEAATTPAGPTLRAVKFAAPAASSISAACGGVSDSGTTSALLREVPAGDCQVKATIEGASYSTRVKVSAPTGYTCTLEGDALACR